MPRFSDIVEQTQLKAHLQNALRTGRVSHAYLIEGEEGAGKKYIAGIFAQALQCPDRQEEHGAIEPCGRCRSCIQAERSTHPDIITLTHEKQGSIGINEIRSGLRDDVAIKPYNGPYKIYLIPDGEKMTIAAQNALLKTLEEPPAYAVILILTTNVSAFLPTILSRCVLLPLKPVSDAGVRAFLKSAYGIDGDRARLIAAFARGNIGRAAALAENERFEIGRKETVRLMKRLKSLQTWEILAAMQQLSPEDGPSVSGAEQKGKTARQRLQADDARGFLETFLLLFRDILVYKATEGERSLIFVDQIAYIKEAAAAYSYRGISRSLDALRSAERRLRANVNTELTLELFLLTVKENL